MRNKEWIVPCNEKVYDCFNAFSNLISLDWHQSRQLTNIQINDIVYIYVSAHYKRITHQCIVNKVNISYLEIPDYDFYVDKSAYSHKGPFIELQCLREFDEIEGLGLVSLRENGVNGNLQGAVIAKENLKSHLLKMVEEQNKIDRFSGGSSKYIEAWMNRNSKDYFTDYTINMSDEALKLFVKEKQKEPVVVKKVTTAQYIRNPYIAEYAKRAAKGKCQLCNLDAPFIDKNGKPYLESHHIIWLSNGGADSIENIVALCPNCHRKMHAINDPNDVDYLKRKILKIEE